MLHFILLVKESEDDSLIFYLNCEGQTQKIYTDDLCTIILFKSITDWQNLLKT